MDAESSWAALPVGAARSLNLAHRTLIAGGLAVGSAIVDVAGVVVAEGRNRAYDDATGTDALERTPIAHAEMNAMACLDTDVATEQLTLWSTQQPCSMCRAAIDFIGIGSVHALATDPSARLDRADETLDDIWVVLATAMFLAGPLRRGGRQHAIIQDNLLTEPESVDLAELVIVEGHPLMKSRSLVDAVAASWNDLGSAAQRRGRRLDAAR